MKKQRFRKIILLSLFTVFVFCIPTSALQMQTPSPIGLAELIINAEKYDNKKIEFEGEAIGNILYRNNGAWVNVSDADNSALGVFTDTDSAEEISVLGRYGTCGDMLLVTGTFNRACSEHGGDMDIHADHIEILSRGKDETPVIPHWLPYFTYGSAACAIFLCCFAFYRIRCYNIGKKSVRDEKTDEK